MCYVNTHLPPLPARKIQPNDNKSLRSAGSWTVSTGALLLVVASAGFGVLFAYEVGSKHSLIFATIYVAFALGLEISKPFAIEAAFRSVRELKIVQAAVLALVGTLAVAYSLQAELQFMSMTRGDMVAERSAEHGAAQRAADRYQRASAELAALAPSRPAQEVAAETMAIDVLPGIVVDGRPCGGTLNGPVTKQHCPRRAELVAEQARSERRATLEAVMRAAEKEQKASPMVAAADPGATALATYLAALGTKVDPETLGLWLPLIGVLALEIGAAFSVVLVRSVSGSSSLPPASPATTGDAVAQVVAQSSKVRKNEPPKRATKKRRPPDDDAGGPPQRGLATWIAGHAPGKVVSLSQRKLARQVGIPRATLQRRMRELADQGAVWLETTTRGTRLALA